MKEEQISEHFGFLFDHVDLDSQTIIDSTPHVWE
jgi:hypothetical protein